MVQLVDQYGRPISTATLKKEQAAPTLTGVRRPNTEHQASGLTPGKLGRLLKSSINGDQEAYLALAEEMEERDLHYAGVLGSRKLQVAGLDITVEAASDSAADVENASDGALALREAVQLVNDMAGDDTIQLAAALEGQTLTLTQRQLTIAGDRMAIMSAHGSPAVSR